ncbi:MAG: rod shape-determining protein MreC [Armatimonadota bacterium]
MLRTARSGLNMRPFVVLIVLALVLTVWQHRARASARNPNSSSLPERAASALTWPLQRLFAATNKKLEGSVSGLGQYRQLVVENQRLRAEKDELTAQKLRLTEAYFENQHLRKLLGFASRDEGDPLVAKVVGVNYGLSRKRLTIMAPPGRQLEVGNIVRTEAGLVGRITDVRAGGRADVFPLIDGEHAVAGVIQRSRDQGMVSVATQLGDQPDMLTMDKVVGRADIREGDVVLTSGLGEVYPAGTPIGTVVATRRSSAGTMDLTATIRPFADFEHLEYVLVMRHGK